MIEINGIRLKLQKGRTILEMARLAGIDVPTLCHDQRVKTYGSCGLCVVEVKGMKNLVRACATEARPGMVISTDNRRVRHSRRLTLELLLSDHCGDCRPPCTLACPAGTDCQGYVGLIANHRFREALILLKESHPLPLSIGLVCPHPCEQACRRQLVDAPIAIADLKAFAASEDIEGEQPYVPAVAESTGKRVAIVGSGPAGLTAAYFLARAGHKATIYEAMPELGGMLRYGIPEYRLPKAWLNQEIELIEKLGVEMITATGIPKDIDLSVLRKKHDAVFIGIGAWKSSLIGCRGEDHPSVVGGIEFLRQVNLKENVSIGERVAVIGGGNTAMDAARSAVRLGASQVMVLYRRTRAEMPAQDIEIAEAEEEGVLFRFLLAPDRIVSDGDLLKGIDMQRMRLGQPDSSGRRSPVATGETEFIEVDTIIAAIGQQVDANGFEETGLSRWNSLDIDELTMQTALTGVFAGGDAVTGPKTAIEAIAQGQKAARSIDCYLRGRMDPQPYPYLAQTVVTAADYAEHPRQPRMYPRHAGVQERTSDFRPVKQVFSSKEARAEAMRCLECGCLDYFECRLIGYAKEYEVEPERWQGVKRDFVPLEEHPFMMGDMNKCILCGLCVRVCDEIMGVNALGLINRGFETVVKPEMGWPWADTSCISCGQCAALCPTGAIVERNSSGKNVPLPLASTATTCSGCDWGCQQTVKSYQGMIVKIEPPQNDILCAKGRFAVLKDQGERITAPLIKRDGRWHKSSFDEAISAMVSDVRQLQAVSRPSLSGVFISPAYTVEEANLALAMAKSLKADYLGSFTNDGGLFQPMVDDRPDREGGTGLEKADLIVLMGSFKNNHIPAVKARQAALAGAGLVVVSPEGSVADDAAHLCMRPADNELSSLDQVMVQNGEALKRLTAAYGENMQTMILVDGHSYSQAVVQSIAAGKVSYGCPGLTDVIVVSPGANAQGIIRAGFKKPFDEIYQTLSQGDMKVIFVLGEDPVGSGLIAAEVLRRAQLLVVMAPYHNKSTELADFVLPGSVPFETEGTYVGANGGLNVLSRVQEPPSGQDNLSILKAIISRVQDVL